MLPLAFASAFVSPGTSMGAQPNNRIAVKNNKDAHLVWAS